MRISQLKVEYSQRGTADIELPDALLSVRGRDGAVPGEMKNVIFLNQVHGSEIIHNPVIGASADGMILSRGTLSPGIRTADCLPVFISSYDYTAAFHAGWRGLASGISYRMIKEFPTEPDFIVLGNCICGDCYQVGPDVREKALRDLPEYPHPPGRLDLKRAALDQMAAAGLSEECTVFDIPECTVCRKDLFFSFRADGSDKRNLTWMKVKGV
ncbi:MAG: polyphenol oxidase family protein [Candidatus Aegiribacteria sp.]|nr:polyphenol oxidase family protein [Candidatus Aegiribacteria sp.]